MKLELEHIQDRISRAESDRAEYHNLAVAWEKMWRLEAFKTTPEEQIKQGLEQVTLPTPFNVVNLAQRLISSKPKIEVPSHGTNELSDMAAEKRERWLIAIWEQLGRQQRRNLVGDATWQSLVRGRHCWDVRYIKDKLPKRLQGKRVPIMIRTLDPLNVIIKEGPLYTEWAAHKYKEDRQSIKQRYPDLKLENKRGRSGRFARDEETECGVVDYWYISSQDGSVWNAIIVDDEFVKEPVKTDYPDIPIIEGRGESAPIDDEGHKSLSILHPLRGLWQYDCRLASQMATGLLWYFWPATTVMNEYGTPVDDIQIRPGETTQVPYGTVINQVQQNPNVPLAQTVQQIIEAAGQNSTFPRVMYGDSGAMQAGYGVSILSDAAKGRIKSFIDNLETSIEVVNQILLSFVEEWGGEDGIEVWAKDESNDALYSVVLKPEDVEGCYDNLVTLTPNIPTDDMQKQITGLRQVQDGIISRQTYRNKYMSITVPSDERKRVELEAAWMSDELKPVVMLNALKSYYPNDWEAIIAGSPLQQVNEQVSQAREQLLNPQQLPGSNSLPPVNGGPPGMPPGGPPPGLPPGMQPPQMGADSPLPPELQGQITPEMLDIMRREDPLLFQQLMGGLPPEEELDLLSGIPR